jgi:phosphoglycerate dehydrogenase-like enzyme
MTIDVACLRPAEDFSRVGVPVPGAFNVAYRAPDSDDLRKVMQSAKAVVMPAVGPKLAPDLFEGSDIALVQVTGAGVDRLDRQAMQRLGIPVANVPGGSNAAVAEYVTTCAATLLRRFAWASGEILRGNYSAFRARLLADNVGGLEGLEAGVVGLGVIGMAVARALHAQGCRIIYYDPQPADPDGAAEVGAQPVDLAGLLARADIVTLHVPLLPATRNLIGREEIASMKPGGVLINAARGGIVDEAALAAALQSGHLGGAAVDVYSTEPPSSDNPLLALSGEAASRALLTPHIAGVTRQASASLFRAAWANVARVLVERQPPLNRVY